MNSRRRLNANNRDLGTRLERLSLIINRENQGNYNTDMS